MQNVIWRAPPAFRISSKLHEVYHRSKRNEAKFIFAYNKPEIERGSGALLGPTMLASGSILSSLLVSSHENLLTI